MADDEEPLSRVAEVPSLGRPIKGDNDFNKLNKELRACFVCRLVKTERQVRLDCVRAQHQPSFGGLNAAAGAAAALMSACGSLC